MKPFEIIQSGEICGLFSLFVLIDIWAGNDVVPFHIFF